MSVNSLVTTLPVRPWWRGVRERVRSGGARHLARAAAGSALSGVLLTGAWVGGHSALSGSGVPSVPVAEVAGVRVATSPARLPHLRETDVTASDTPLPDGWTMIPGKEYSIALPHEWLVLDKKAAGNQKARATLEAAFPFDAEVIAALATRVSDEKLALVAVEMPWRAGGTTVTIAAVTGQLSVDGVTEAVRAAGADGASPILGDQGFAFRFDSPGGRGGNAQVVSTCLLPLGSAKHLVVQVSADQAEQTNVHAIADGIVATFQAP